MHKLEVISIKNIESIVINKSTAETIKAKAVINRSQTQSEEDPSVILARMSFELTLPDEEKIDPLDKSVYVKSEYHAVFRSLVDYESFDKDELLEEITINLFPYLRTKVSELTKDAGLKSVEIPFDFIYKSSSKNENQSK
ncbi:MAG TPA: hypothetical protein DCX82_15805 [Lachnospiraceae bacterium]|jgi:preprotein translocase subunit SecB|nr:hypothetical protein [Lachnospiraceae bacterium]